MLGIMAVLDQKDSYAATRLVFVLSSSRGFLA